MAYGYLCIYRRTGRSMFCDAHGDVASVLMPVAHTEIDKNSIHTPHFRLTLTNAGTTLQCLISNKDKWIVVFFL